MKLKDSYWKHRINTNKYIFRKKCSSVCCLSVKTKQKLLLWALEISCTFAMDLQTYLKDCILVTISFLNKFTGPVATVTPLVHGVCYWLLVDNSSVLEWCPVMKNVLRIQRIRLFCCPIYIQNNSIKCVDLNWTFYSSYKAHWSYK